MSSLDIEFFAERAMLASKDRDSADWQSLMKDIIATEQGIGVLARLAGRLPGVTLQIMLENSLPVLSEWSREDYLDLFSRTESEVGLYDLEGIFWLLGGLSRSAVATLLGGRREPQFSDWPGRFFRLGMEEELVELEDPIEFRLPQSETASSTPIELPSPVTVNIFERCWRREKHPLATPIRFPSPSEEPGG